MDLQKATKKELLERLDEIERAERIVPPKVSNPDWSKVIKLAEGQAAEMSERGYSSKDTQQFIYENVMLAVYGPDYFDWSNRMIK